MTAYPSRVFPVLNRMTARSSFFVDLSMLPQARRASSRERVKAPFPFWEGGLGVRSQTSRPRYPCSPAALISGSGSSNSGGTNSFSGSPINSMIAPASRSDRFAPGGRARPLDWADDGSAPGPPSMLLCPASSRSARPDDTPARILIHHSQEATALEVQMPIASGRRCCRCERLQALEEAIEGLMIARAEQVVADLSELTNEAGERVDRLEGIGVFAAYGRKQRLQGTRAGVGPPARCHGEAAPRAHDAPAVHRRSQRRWRSARPLASARWPQPSLLPTWRRVRPRARPAERAAGRAWPRPVPPPSAALPRRCFRHG